MKDKKIYIEVGANKGTDTERFINDDSIVICFEPSMELAYELWYKFKKNDNVIILPFAIDNDNGFKKFNIAGTSNWGCSSLNDFNPNIHNIWLNRPDFNFTDNYTVPTITLYDFIKIYNIKEIEYLWIDAQGHDFNVLKSLKDKLNIVKRGRCEAAYDIALYDGVDNNYQNIINYLNDFDFTCEIEMDKSGLNAECDIIFNNNNNNK